MSEKKKKGLTAEECVQRWDAAVSKIRQRCWMSKSPVARALYVSLTSETGELDFPQDYGTWLELLDLLEREFGPLWPKSPDAN
jgi:hypothetical protein